jgi:hypothetical protein
MNGEFMTSYNQLLFGCVFFLMLWGAPQVFAERLFPNVTLPSNVVISGVIHPDDGTTYNGQYEALLTFFNDDGSAPPVNITQQVTFFENYFRIQVDLAATLQAMFLYRKKMFVRLSIDDVNITLPFASVPVTIKSGLANTTNQMIDDSVMSIDYDQQRIGIGTSVPSSTVHVVGTVNATAFFEGDGSQLTNLKYAGGDNYNFLESENGEFIVITVNATGKMMVGGRMGVDSPTHDLQVYGSLLVEPNERVSSDIISGAGSRWMWYADRSVLRIGYTPSIYWDDAHSGDDSIAFGYATIAKGHHAIVGGGYYNNAQSDWSIIAGGSDNAITGAYGIILGGQKNTIRSESSIILGGRDNIASKDAIVLGGFDNASFGIGGVISGYRNFSSGDEVLILGGKNNTGFASASYLIGSNITTIKEHPRSLMINASNGTDESVVSSHIKIKAPAGVGIGTNETISNGLIIDGAVSANILYGDGSQIRNLRNPESAWTPHPLDPNVLTYPYRLGVLRSDLLESLNVSGSIHLSGVAQADPGTIRYENDVFSVYKPGAGWVSLQMTDTDTTYNATEGMALDDSNLTFYIATQDATIGQVKKWNGQYWDHGYLDQFVEEPELSRRNDVSLPKRLYLPTGDVAINLGVDPSSVTPFNAPFAVVTNPKQSTGLYLFDQNAGHETMISVSVSPPGLHFQGYYDGAMFRQTNQDGGGIVQNENTLSMYVDDATGVAVRGLSISSTNIRIFEGDFNDPSVPFYVGGDMASRSFVFHTDLDRVGVYFRAPYEQHLDRSVVFEQQNNGELLIQSANHSGDIIFRNHEGQIAVLASGNGQTKFGLTRGSPRSEFDIERGDAHVSDGYGIQFNQQSEKKSAIRFDTTDSKRIQIHTSSNFDVPNVEVTELGNVGVHGPANDAHDLLVNAVSGRHSVVQIDTVESENAGLLLQSDGVVGDGDFSDPGESYFFGSSGDSLSLTNGDQSAMMISQDGHVGVHDLTPTSALSIGADIVMLNQSGIFMKDADGTSAPLIAMTGDTVQLKSSNNLQFLDSNGEISLSITNTGVAINRHKLLTQLNDAPIGFEVSGSVMINGDIFNSIGDKIFPLDVSNANGTTQASTINTIHIDTASGLSLAGDNVSNTLLVKGAGYYNRIKLPNGDILSATKNMDLRLVGRGITIMPNNYEDQGTLAVHDSLRLINDFASGGGIQGDLSVRGNVRVINHKIYGNAAGLTDIPFHWQHVTRNNTTIPDVPGSHPDTYSDEGEIYYMLGNVGIQTESPSTLFEVVGTSSIKALIVPTKLMVSDVVSTGNLYVDATKRMAFRSNQGQIIFGRNAAHEALPNFSPWMAFTKDSQWLIGTNHSNYLMDIGQGSVNDETQVRIESDLSSQIDFKRRSSDVSLRLAYDDTGSRFDQTLDNPNIQINASHSLGLYPNESNAIVMNENGHVGIFTRQPKNSLDINGEMSIGYEAQAPPNGLIVKRLVGVGMRPENLPRYPLEVSGSAIIGEPYVSGISSGFFIHGDGSHRLFVGGDPIGSEKVFFNDHLSIKDGALYIREGVGVGTEIIRDNTTAKADQWNQVNANKGLKINATKELTFKTFGGSQWEDELVLDSVGQLGIGTSPNQPLHIFDNDNDVSVKIKSSHDASIHLKYASHQAMIGTTTKGFQIKTHSSSFANSELTIVQNTVGFHQSDPDSRYKVEVGGTLNASDYRIKDQYSASGFRSFQTVPTGVVILWLREGALPTGWAECNGSNGCPNMADRYVKGWDGSSQNLQGAGGSHQGVLSATTHMHTNALHHHRLTSPGHTHGVTVDDHRVYTYLNYDDAYRDGAGTTGSSYTILTDLGRHRHLLDVTHNHDSITFKGGGHGDQHNNSEENSHGHGGPNASPSDTETVGTGANARGYNGDKHQHTFDNKPQSRAVRFIVKVDE